MQEMLYEDSPYLVTAYTTDRRGVPQRPVRVLPAAARPRRGPAVPVRRPQLPAPPGRRGRRLRRRHDSRSARPTAVGPAASGSTTAAALRWSSAASSCSSLLVPAAGSGRCVGGRPRPSANDRRRDATVVAGAPTPAGRPATQLRPVRRRQGASGAARQPRASSWCVNFFLFRVLPGDPARTLGRGRFRTEEQLEEFRADLRPRPAAAAAVPDLPEEHAHRRPRRLAALPGAGLPT